jgi:hypothetical protein
LAASPRQIAEGINHLQAAVKPAQLATLINETGEDVLRRIGDAGGLPDKLAKVVGRARSVSEAYRRLMSGSTRLKLPGLNEVLIKTETRALTTELAVIRKQFGHTIPDSRAAARAQQAQRDHPDRSRQVDRRSASDYHPGDRLLVERGGRHRATGRAARCGEQRAPVAGRGRAGGRRACWRRRARTERRSVPS